MISLWILGVLAFIVFGGLLFTRLHPGYQAPGYDMINPPRTTFDKTYL